MIQPLADQLRPKKLSEIYGQEHLLSEDGLISAAIQSGRPLSLILWGPPGCGKTSIARLYAAGFALPFRTLNATFSGVKELKEIVKEVEETPLLGRSCLLFVDEIHRFNKAQQDAFLPFIEKGTLVLVGATAENPSFYLNDALLSRLRVLTLTSLNQAALEKILEQCEQMKGKLPLTKEARQMLLEWAQGDGRYLLNLAEGIVTRKYDHLLTVQEVEKLLQRRPALFDKSGEHHHHLISALHKSVRSSDADASLYWFARLLEGGESPLFIARRLIRMASEDVGLADPQALQLAVAARDAYQMLGSPEGELALAEAVVYLALSPKSNALYEAYGAVRECARTTNHLPPPKHLMNAPTKLMKEHGYSKGYVYDHQTEEGCSGQLCFPEPLGKQCFYQPVERGFEREMKKRLTYFQQFQKNG